MKKTIVAIPRSFQLALALALLCLARPVLGQRPMGTDVSSYQGSGINWAAVKGDGVSFAWTKATESTNYIDGDFTVNEANAKAAGVLIGAYHFARPSKHPNITGIDSADTEAQYFWATAGNYVVGGGNYLVPMLDWEDTDVTNAGLNFTATTMSEWVNEWCNDVSNYAYAATGIAIRPVVYTGTWYSYPGTYPGLTSTVTQWPSWIADYPYCTGDDCGSPTPQTSAPGGTYPWPSWNLWQYGDTNWSGGDSDVFNGTMAQFTSLFVMGKPSTAAPANATVYWDPGKLDASPGSGGSGSWDTYSSNWWFGGGTDVAFSTAGDNAVFAGTAGTVTINTSVLANAITFNTPGYSIGGSGTLSFNGSTTTITIPSGTPTYFNGLLAGSGYTLTGGGVAVLSNPGNYCGSSASPEVVNGPNTTLVALTDHDTGNDGVPLHLQNGGIYQDNDTTSGDEFLLPGCAISLLTGGGIFDNPNASLYMSNLISGAGSLTFTGYTNSSGTPYVLTLTDAANSYSGGTMVQGPGELKASAAGTLGSTTAPLTVNGGILDLGGASHTAGTVTIAGGKLQDGALTGSAYAGQSGTISAVLAGSAALTKTTTGTLTLSGANTFTGVTTISGGLLQVSADNNLGLPGSTRVTNRLTLSGGISAGLRNTASYTMNANRGIALTGSGGSLQSTTGVTVAYPNIITGSGGLGIGSSSSLGYGVTILSANNTYTGPTTIAAGTLRLGVNGALPPGTPLTINPDNNTGGGGVFDMNGFSQAIGPLATGTGVGGAGTDIPTISLTGQLTVIQTNINTIFSGNIIGLGGSLIKLGGATLTLAGTNTYNGSTLIGSGTLALAATGSISNTTNLIITSGSTLNVSAQAAFALGSNTTLSASGTAAEALIIGGASVSLGSQPIVLTYDGSHPPLVILTGTLSLGGNAFTINDAALPGGTYTLVETSGAIASAGAFTVKGPAIPTSGAISYVSASGNSVILTIIDNTVPAAATGLALLANGAAQLNFSGTPFYTYTIQAASNLTPPSVWTDIGASTADSNGFFNFIDTGATNFGQRFYRSYAP